MPRRPPIDPEGYYHVSTRGVYGRALFRTDDERELFLRLYTKAALRYDWITLDWVLMSNHHHFVVRLTQGGLSEGMRVLHGGFSRRIHLIYGMTGQGHLVRHGFFARRLATDDEVIGACCYVDLNVPRATGTKPRQSRWSGYRSLVGLEHPRPFHRPSELLQLISPSPANARAEYRNLVHDVLASRRHVSSPNHGVGLEADDGGGHGGFGLRDSIGA